MKRLSFLSFLAAIIAIAPLSLLAASEEKPNIVFILVDDMGWGDTQATDPKCRIPTPYLNKLASEGISFTDAHAGSSLCTPSRYGLLTGRYAWRGRCKTGVLGGFSVPLIEKGRLTVASLLKQNGYATACFGKWHLGLGMAKQKGVKRIADWNANAKSVDWEKPISPSVLDFGFDRFYGIAGSLDMSPYIWIDNDRFVGKATKIGATWKENPAYGPMEPNYNAENVVPEVTRRTCEYIKGRKDYREPFFLYAAIPAPHAPCLPTPEFQGTSGLGKYGDFCVEVDAMVGKICRAIDEAGFRENTILLFASDNGFWRLLNPQHLIAQGHHPSGPYRGYKSEIFEGGHRTPFFVRWPGKIKAGSKSAEPVSLVDLMATCADILGVKLPDNAGEDSASLLPVLTGKQKGPVHTCLFHHTNDGSLGIRMGKWKLARCPGSGDDNGWNRAKRSLSAVQLFDMEADPYEKVNLKDKYPEVVKKLLEKLDESVKSGRSVPHR